MRYDTVEYFWINDMTLRIVMHPIKPELDGKDVGGMKDPNGFALFRGFVEVVKAQGAGFVADQWPKPGSDVPVDKVSSVKGFEPWGWVIGSAVDVDDLRAAASHRWQREREREAVGVRGERERGRRSRATPAPTRSRRPARARAARGTGRRAWRAAGAAGESVRSRPGPSGGSPRRQWSGAPGARA